MESDFETKKDKEQKLETEKIHKTLIDGKKNCSMKGNHEIKKNKNIFTEIIH